MYRTVSPEKRRAAREFRELLPPTYARIAALSGLHASTIKEIASVENWPTHNFVRGTVMVPVRGNGLPLEVAASDASAGEAAELPPGNIGALVIDEMRMILAGAKAGRIDKARTDALLSMIRVAERLGKLEPDTGQQEQMRSDEELAEILTRVDRRIVELARDYAERLVAERADAA